MNQLTWKIKQKIPLQVKLQPITHVTQQHHN